MHLHSCNPTFHKRTQNNFAQNGIGQHAVGTPLQLCFGQVSLSFQAHYFVLCCIRMLQETGEYWFAWHIHQLSVDCECRNVWINSATVHNMSIFPEMVVWEVCGQYHYIPIKMSQITNPVFSNCNQLYAMRRKDGWSDTWLQRSAHLTQFCIQL